jgi:ankyrin repeat protein
MEAIKTGHGSLVPLLLEHKADPSLKDAQGRTAADFARKRGDDRAAAALQKR